MIKLIKVDKSRDVKRGGSRLSKQNKQSGLIGDSLSSEKSKFKKLSSVNKTSNEVKEEKCQIMGCDVSGREAEELPSQPTPKKLKLPRKHFEDCNGVDHASVPRKLRSDRVVLTTAHDGATGWVHRHREYSGSHERFLLDRVRLDECCPRGRPLLFLPQAMKKRNRESLSPPFVDSKTLKHNNGGVQSSKRDGVKRLKRHGCPGWSQKQSVCGPITKDEEEVVETLYALAGMFPDSDPNYESKLDGASLHVSCSASPEARANCPPIFEDSIAIKEVLNTNCFSTAPAVPDPTSIVQRLPEETVKVNSSNEFRVRESNMWYGVEKNKTEIDGFATQVDQLTMLSKHEEQKSLFNSNDLFVLPELYLDPCKLKQPTKLETSLLNRKPDIALGLMPTESEVNQQHMNNGSKREGPTLWPGLSSTVTNGAWTVGLSSLHSASKIPSWMDTALSNSRPNSFQNGSSPGKVLKVNTDRGSWKRCAAHVHISRLIRSLKTPESKDNFSVHPKQQKPDDLFKQGSLVTVNDFNGVRIGLNGVKAASSITMDTEKTSKESKNDILSLRRLHQDQPQAALASGMYTTHMQPKQSYNFLSLSAGDGRVEANTSFRGYGNVLEPLPQLQVPYLHSNSQYPTLMPSFSQTRHASSSYLDQSSVSAAQQAQLQLPSYLGNPFNGLQASPTNLTKQQQYQQLLQQQQQQRLWASHMAAQYGTAAATSSGLAHYPSWQDFRPVNQPSPSSMEIHGRNYPQFSQQQQNFMTIAPSLPQARVNKQDHLSSVNDETGGVFHSGNNALPLQLLCNDRL